MEKIVCENVCKSFDKSVVLDGLSLSVTENEFVAIVGPGRCGKTTLINILSGLDTAACGQVLMDGRPVTCPAPSRGVVYQTTLLFPWLNCLKNVAYGPRSQGKSRAESKRIALEYIHKVGLDGFEKAYPSSLSGGMKQRAGIARVYASGAEVIFMDEPFGHLDAQTRYLMQDELSALRTLEKKTVIFVTNNIEEAVYLADRVLVMSACPARIKREFNVDLPRPRSYVSKEFLELRAKISEVIDRTE